MEFNILSCGSPTTTTIIFTAAIAIFITILIALSAFAPERRDTGTEACRRLGLTTSSNIADELDSEYDGSTQKEKGNSWRVKSLWIYPLKSCKGVELQQSTVTSLGMLYDRQFSFAYYTNLTKKASDPVRMGWKILTQREVPALTTVRTEVWVPDPSSPAYSWRHPNVLSSGVIVIKWPATEAYKQKHSITESDRSVHIPFSPTWLQIRQGKYESKPITIWNDAPSALKLASTEGFQSQEGCNTWIRDLLEYLWEESKRQNPPRPSTDGKEIYPGFNFDLTKPFALFRIASRKPRKVFRNAPTKKELGYQPTVGLQDAYPLNIQNLASVRDVASKLEPGAPPLSVKNFRTNIVLTGGDAYAEDGWKQIMIGDHEYDVSCRTARCLMPNIDQASGKKGPSEPNKTLRSFRKIDEGCKNEACLGMQMVPLVKEARQINVGDTVEVLRTGPHFYLEAPKA